LSVITSDVKDCSLSKVVFMFNLDSMRVKLDLMQLLLHGVGVVDFIDFKKALYQRTYWCLSCLKLDFNACIVIAEVCYISLL